jgi:uncharacterized protein
MFEKKYLKSTWYDARLKILPSDIHGKGMFATLPIKKGEILTVIGGVILTENKFDDYVRTVPKYNAIQIEEGIHLVDTTIPSEFMDGSINHSCDSNSWMKDEVTLVARKDIAQGEEITVDYALFTTNSNWELKECQCGSPNCRHIVSGSDWKIKSVQDQYHGHFSPYINKRIRNLLKSQQGH